MYFSSHMRVSGSKFMDGNLWGVRLLDMMFLFKVGC